MRLRFSAFLGFLLGLFLGHILIFALYAIFSSVSIVSSSVDVFYSSPTTRNIKTQTACASAKGCFN